jgi:hypothetical protein
MGTKKRRCWFNNIFSRFEISIKFCVFRYLYWFFEENFLRVCFKQIFKKCWHVNHYSFRKKILAAYLSVFLPVCLFFCRFTSLVCLCLYVCLFACISVFVYIYLSVHLLYVFMYACLPVCLSFYLLVCLSV